MIIFPCRSGQFSSISLTTGANKEDDLLEDESRDRSASKLGESNVLVNHKSVFLPTPVNGFHFLTTCTDFRMAGPQMTACSGVAI